MCISGSSRSCKEEERALWANAWIGSSKQCARVGIPTQLRVVDVVYPTVPVFSNVLGALSYQKPNRRTDISPSHLSGHTTKSIL